MTKLEKFISMIIESIEKLFNNSFFNRIIETIRSSVAWIPQFLSDIKDSIIESNRKISEELSEFDKYVYEHENDEVEEPQDQSQPNNSVVENISESQPEEEPEHIDVEQTNIAANASDGLLKPVIFERENVEISNEEPVIPQSSEISQVSNQITTQTNYQIVPQPVNQIPEESNYIDLSEIRRDISLLREDVNDINDSIIDVSEEISEANEAQNKNKLSILDSLASMKNSFNSKIAVYHAAISSAIASLKSGIGKIFTTINKILENLPIIILVIGVIAALVRHAYEALLNWFNGSVLGQASKIISEEGEHKAEKSREALNKGNYNEHWVWSMSQNQSLNYDVDQSTSDLMLKPSTISTTQSVFNNSVSSNVLSLNSVEDSSQESQDLIQPTVQEPQYSFTPQSEKGDVYSNTQEVTNNNVFNNTNITNITIRTSQYGRYT